MGKDSLAFPDGILGASLWHHWLQLSSYLQAQPAPKRPGPGWHSNATMWSCHEATTSPVTGPSRLGGQCPQLDGLALVLLQVQHTVVCLLPDTAPWTSRFRSHSEDMLPSHSEQARSRCLTKTVSILQLQPSCSCSFRGLCYLEHLRMSHCRLNVTPAALSVLGGIPQFRA